jgi:hypothetical protein
LDRKSAAVVNSDTAEHHRGRNQFHTVDVFVDDIHTNSLWGAWSQARVVRTRRDFLEFECAIAVHNGFEYEWHGTIDR